MSLRLSFQLDWISIMGKSKSSASSATRKKHAKKAAEDEEGVPAAQPAQRGQKKAAKKSRFEPKVKSYTPPPAPPRGAPDPVDLYLGGGSEVDSELVVILRKLGKRDEATISKGVEGLESWIRELLREESKGPVEEESWKLEQQREQIVSSMAVWVRSLCRSNTAHSLAMETDNLTIRRIIFLDFRFIPLDDFVYKRTRFTPSSRLLRRHSDHQSSSRKPDPPYSLRFGLNR